MTDWLQFRFDSNHPGSNPSESELTTAKVEAGLAEKWHYQTPGPVGAEPVVAGGRVYVGCKNGSLYGVPTDYDISQPASVQRLGLCNGGPWGFPSKWDPSGTSP